MNHNFITAVTPHLVPVLLKQLTKQEEGQESDDTVWNLAMASGTCLGLLARTAQVSDWLKVCHNAARLLPGESWPAFAVNSRRSVIDCINTLG